jgi:hypothetical protein
MHKLEHHRLLPDMQLGSRPSKLCNTAILNKRLTIDIHSYKKQPMAFIENDAVGCYDRIVNPLVLIFLKILGVSPNTVDSLAHTWSQTMHSIRTLYGTSTQTYKNHPDKLLYGPGQGSTIGPLLWLLCFILINHSLSSTAPSITLRSVSGDTITMYRGESFVDDTGLGVNGDAHSTSNEELMRNL